jgi:hypothetical protein
MEFLHCKDLPLWAEILLQTKEDRSLEVCDDPSTRECHDVCEKVGRAA